MDLADLPPARSIAGRASAALRRACSSAVFSYGLVFAIQLKLIWQIWRYRDMTGGDTASYFGSAYLWATQLQIDFVWSPLYTAYYGTAYAALGDAYDATILHRALIAVLASLGVLAVARQMLPPAIALLIGVWWAVLPINFEVYYEVHLFALLPVLAAWLLAMRADTTGYRGAALAVLVLTTVLLRNEYSVACLLYGLYCLWREIGVVRSSGRRALRRIVPKYAIPLAITALICLFFYWRTPYSNEHLLKQVNGKHWLNMCQVYAVGFGQRHPEWTANPWIDCQGLMAQTFGTERPSLWQMIGGNFPAVLDHFLWNLSLTGSGLQIALFNAASGQVNPDYTPRELGASYPVWLSVLALGIVAAGLALVIRDGRARWSAAFQAVSYRWIPLLAVAATSLPVILTQRPRPEYLYTLTVLLMLLIGGSLQILTRRAAPAVQLCSAAIGLATLLFVPPYYPAHDTGRPDKAAYERLRPYAAVLGPLPGDLLFGGDANALGSWLGLSKLLVRPQHYLPLPSWDARTDLCATLDCRKVSALYVPPSLMGAVAGPGFCPKDPDGFPWLVVGTKAEMAEGILLIRKSDGVTLPSSLPAIDCMSWQPDRKESP